MRKSAFCGLFAAVSVIAGAEMKTPETSSLFEKWTDPESGVASYKLKDNLVAPNQQSFYFVNKSMTEDGRFLVFWTSDDERVNPKTKRFHAVIDFEKDVVYPINLRMRHTNYLDVDTDKLYYIDERGIFLRDLLDDPMKEVKICDIPEAFKAEGKIRNFYTHLTLSHDKTFMFIDTRVEGTDRWIQGVIDIKNCRWEKWNETDFVINHGQLHPFRNDIALCAHETSWVDSKGVKHKIQNVDGVYPRLQLIEPGFKRTMVPPMDNYATHERWDDQGDGFYWCGRAGVFYCDLATMKQWRVAPYGAHAMMSPDRNYVVSDLRIGPFYRGCYWRVMLWSQKDAKQTYLLSTAPAMATQEKETRLHPDPHPQFVCGGKYVIWSYTAPDKLIHLMVTPMEGVRARIERVTLNGLEGDNTPEAVAERITEDLLDAFPAPQSADASLPALWVNAMQIAEKHGDRKLQESLARKIHNSAAADYPLAGAVQLETYVEKGWNKLREPGLRYAASVASAPVKSGDQLFDAALVQIEAFRTTGDPSYIDGIAERFENRLRKRLKRDGWSAAALPYLLRFLKPGDKGYNAVFKKYTSMMEELLKTQRTDGLWESADASALYVYAIVEGINHGWLDAGTFEPVAKKAWLKLCSQAFMSDVCKAGMMMACNSMI